MFLLNVALEFLKRLLVYLITITSSLTLIPAEIARISVILVEDFLARNRYIVIDKAVVALAGFASLQLHRCMQFATHSRFVDRKVVEAN